MTPEEMEFWKEAIKSICDAWGSGALFIGIGIGIGSIKDIFK